VLWCVSFLARSIHAGVVSAQATLPGYYRAPSSLTPFVATSCPLAGKKDLFKRAWELAPSETDALLRAVEKAHGALDGVELGSRRELTVAEALLWTEMCGPLFAAEVAVFVGATSSSEHYLSVRLMQKAAAFKLYNYTELSVTAYLSTPMFRAALPPLYKLGSLEVREEQAAAEAAAHMEELNHKAAGFGSFSGGSEAAAAIACAEAAAPGDSLRDAYMARRQLDELERRDQALFEACVREKSALDAVTEAEVREAEDLFVMQELELMVDVPPRARTTRPAAAGLWTTCSSTFTASCPETPWTCPRTWPACSRRPPARCPPEVPAGVPAGEVHRMVHDGDEVPEPSSRWTRWSSGAATSSNGQQRVFQRL